MPSISLLPVSKPDIIFILMLKSLKVKNLAVVENATVDFSTGLNIITGETGAGKSLIIGALNILLGERADKTLIRTGEEQCGIEAIFELKDSGDIDAIMEEIGMQACSNGELIIRRTISANGAGKISVNDSPATLQLLKQIGTMLIDMHGPHDHQSLLSPDCQLDILDSFGHSWKTRSAYEEEYKQLSELRQKRLKLEKPDNEVSAQIDLLKYQIKEIEESGIIDLDEKELLTEHNTAANASEITELTGSAARALTDADESASNALASAQQYLTRLQTLLPDAETWLKEIQSAALTVQEISRTITEKAESIEADQKRMQWLDEKMSILQKFKKKYAHTIPEIKAHLEKSKERLHSLETLGEQLAEIDTALSRQNKKVVTAGNKLSVERNEAARKLATSITKELKDLGFTHGAFGITAKETEPATSGMDSIEFGFAPNAGETMRPLSSIASSGEISRVMLALKACLAKHDKIPVLVFDEIDSNVGGEMGSAVGRKLATVADHHQVLCITHLPQVAAQGSTHYVVRKSVSGGRTSTTISTITGKDRTEEIARMLGGKDLTSVTLKHAREMLDKFSSKHVN